MPAKIQKTNTNTLLETATLEKAIANLAAAVSTADAAIIRYEREIKARLIASDTKPEALTNKQMTGLFTD